MTIVVDANVVATLATAGALARLARSEPIAPALMWSEAISAIRQSRWRGEIDELTEERAVDAVLASRISRRSTEDVYRRSLRLSRSLGWAKTYDAEYIALAEIERAPFVTLDGRLRRRVAGIVTTVELADVLA